MSVIYKRRLTHHNIILWSYKTNGATVNITQWENRFEFYVQEIWSLSNFTLTSFRNVEVQNETESLSIVPYGKHNCNLNPVTATNIKLDVW